MSTVLNLSLSTHVDGVVSPAQSFRNLGDAMAAAKLESLASARHAERGQSMVRSFRDLGAALRQAKQNSLQDLTVRGGRRASPPPGERDFRGGGGFEGGGGGEGNARESPRPT